MFTALFIMFLISIFQIATYFSMTHQDISHYKFQNFGQLYYSTRPGREVLVTVLGLLQSVGLLMISAFLSYG